MDDTPEHLQASKYPSFDVPLHSSENQSRAHLVSLGRPSKPPKHPCLPSTLFARVDLILLQPTFLSLPLIQMSTDLQLNPGPIDAHSPHTISLSNKGLRVCHWNIYIRSFRTTKYEEIGTLLENDESWLDDTAVDSEIYIPGYKIERKDRNGKVAGGVLMYISSHITYCRASPYESSDLELLCVKIAPCKSNCPLFLVGVYRPESSADMDQQLENTLD